MICAHIMVARRIDYRVYIIIRPKSVPSFRQQ